MIARVISSPAIAPFTVPSSCLFSSHSSCPGSLAERGKSPSNEERKPSSAQFARVKAQEVSQMMTLDTERMPIDFTPEKGRTYPGCAMNTLFLLSVSTHSLPATRASWRLPWRCDINSDKKGKGLTIRNNLARQKTYHNSPSRQNQHHKPKR